MITFLYLSWMHLYIPQNTVMKQMGAILAIVTVAFCVIYTCRGTYGALKMITFLYLSWIRGLPTIIECTFQLHNHSARNPQLNKTK